MDSISLNYSLIIIIISSFLSCKNFSDLNKETNMKEKNDDEFMYRPNIHFAPQKNWMNDPNGMFYHKGKYHLYFQHNPNSNVWGPMHWGHATSENLIHWNEHPIALYPDKLGTIFSGSAVVDLENTSGFGSIENPPIVAIFTNHNSEEEKKGSELFQNQSIAYSLDDGYSWEKYNGNPVIKNPGIKDFRDPKVIWYEKDKKWILTLAASQVTKFYESKDLKKWNFISSFGEGIGNHNGVWECPDLFELQVKGTSKTKWVHLVSINPGGPNGGSATQYFVGDFNGKKFTIDEKFENQMKKNHDFWTDFGRDNYAGVTYFNGTNNKFRKLYQGWMSNWQYAGLVPTKTWRSAMTLPRELELHYSQQGGYRLRSKIISQLEKNITKTLEIEDQLLKEKTIIANDAMIDLSSTKIQMKLSDMEKTMYSFVLSNSQGDSLKFGYDHELKKFFIDRSKSGIVNFSKNFVPNSSYANRLDTTNDLNVVIILDKTSIELFYDNGDIVMTEIFFPKAPYEKLSLYYRGTKTSLKELKIQEIKK